MKFKGKVAVLGGRDISDEIYNDSVAIGKMFAERGYLVYCGGGQGVMEAICKGVENGGGTSVGILKGSSTKEANQYLKIPILTNMGITRNALLPLNADVALAISGSYGTLSEIAYALQLEVPVIGYQSWDIPGMIKVDSIEDLIIKIDSLIK